MAIDTFFAYIGTYDDLEDKIEAKQIEADTAEIQGDAQEAEY